MHTRMVRAFCLAALLVIGTGCPGATIVTGTWVFQFSHLQGDYGLNLVQPDFAIAFDNGSGLFEGPTYWDVRNGQLILEQHAQTGTFIYEGDIQHDGVASSGTFREQYSLHILVTWSGSKQ
jgi:hypothetical protein